MELIRNHKFNILFYSRVTYRKGRYSQNSCQEQLMENNAMNVIFKIIGNKENILEELEKFLDQLFDYSFVDRIRTVIS